MVIGKLPKLCARRYPNKKATVFQGSSQTFAQFNTRVNQLCSVFRAHGLSKGAKVATLLRNCPEVMEICMATAKMGIVLVPINFRLVPAELKFVINDAGIDLLFWGDAFKKEISAIRNDIQVKHTLSLADEYENLLAEASSEELELQVSPDDLFAIFYTSGTTGGPKGVMLTHDNFLSAAINHVIAYQLGPNDVCLHVMPLYHTMEASMMICQFYVGGTNVIVDAFDADEFWKLVDSEKLTHLTLVYPMLRDIIDVYKEKGYVRGTFRHFSIGGQTTPTQIMKEALETFGAGSVFPVYGLTEASPLLTYLPREDMVINGEKSRLLGSVGKELFSCHVRVVNDEDRDVTSGEMGEIIAQGPNVMKGYWKREKETQEALAGGWLRTGDVGTLDNEGYLYIIDRKKELIISGGENISPHEIEEVLYKHSAVAECAAIGVPDERWGEQVKAVVVLKLGETVSEKDLIQFARENLAAYKCPRSVDFVEDLPKDPVGKIQKRVLQQQYSQ
ncbi:MAG: long-chain-fatty-acid--CoA ligase [Deltaproteobacteria bacterium]|nr:long-chain-fatty-acid--CoA ligase [Deltaproteobacteria bacterium]